MERKYRADGYSDEILARCSHPCYYYSSTDESGVSRWRTAPQTNNGARLGQPVLRASVQPETGGTLVRRFAYHVEERAICRSGSLVWFALWVPHYDLQCLWNSRPPFVIYTSKTMFLSQTFLVVILSVALYSRGGIKFSHLATNPSAAVVLAREAILL